MMAVVFLYFTRDAMNPCFSAVHEWSAQKKAVDLRHSSTMQPLILPIINETINQSINQSINQDHGFWTAYLAMELNRDIYCYYRTME